MDDTMIGKFITELPMDDPSEMRVSSKPIHYIKELGSGVHGAVYLAVIESKEYAIKVWKWQSDIDLAERLRIYTSPFSHECRAFARLQSRGENGTWAVKCHGWIKLSDEQYRSLPRRYGFPLIHWAIVKEYLPNPIQLSDIPEIVRKKEIARQALMYNPHNCDILPRNFRGSFIVDLGNTITYPYPLYWSNWGFENAYETLISG
ncbi:hypothetical protein PHISCL_09575 [Aspergillus sclerotialis]|uniref:Protein kinase domain-containing protein n=1 Tax=Aspergillus sclerotialis TaxID=2070753 RepID=A0A3A2ZFJ4_9EURO|nr:hypothetical protein PHISCL_09575 [Aspergillus sclerotialis]